MALEIEKGEVLVLDPSNGETTAPESELPPGTHGRIETAAQSDEDLEKFLAKAQVIASRDLGRGSTRPRLVVQERNGHTQRAVFKAVQEEPGVSEEADRYQHEVAAYRLDRRLGQKMVPVTVIRRIEQQVGSLQQWIERAVDQQAAIAYDLGLYHTAKARRQLALGAIFDALIGNHNRQPTDILLLLNGDGIRLIDHSKAFSTSSEIEWNDPSFIDPNVAVALRSLDRVSLHNDLGDLLSELQIEALLIRRDKILERLELRASGSPGRPG